MTITGVYEIAIPVRDLPRAEGLYRELLGLEVGCATRGAPGRPADPRTAGAAHARWKPRAYCPGTKSAPHSMNAPTTTTLALMPSPQSMVSRAAATAFVSPVS